MTKHEIPNKDLHERAQAVKKGLERLDRHSGKTVNCKGKKKAKGGAVSQSPKKGGRGKFNWGAPGAETDYVEVLDKNDPNYDPEEEDQETIQKPKEEVAGLDFAPELPQTVEPKTAVANE